MQHPLASGMVAPSPDTVLAVAVLAAVLLASPFRLRWLGWWERPLALLARRRRLAIPGAAGGSGGSVVAGVRRPRAERPRRVQLPAGGRYLRARPLGECAAPVLDAF